MLGKIIFLKLIPPQRVIDLIPVDKLKENQMLISWIKRKKPIKITIEEFVEGVV